MSADIIEFVGTLPLFNHWGRGKLKKLIRHFNIKDIKKDFMLYSMKDQ